MGICAHLILAQHGDSFTHGSSGVVGRTRGLTPGGKGRVDLGQGWGRREVLARKWAEDGDDVPWSPFLLEKWPEARLCWKKNFFGSLGLEDEGVGWYVRTSNRRRKRDVPEQYFFISHLELWKERFPVYENTMGLRSGAAMTPPPAGPRLFLFFVFTFRVKLHGDLYHIQGHKCGMWPHTQTQTQHAGQRISLAFLLKFPPPTIIPPREWPILG